MPSSPRKPMGSQCWALESTGDPAARASKIRKIHARLTGNSARCPLACKAVALSVPSSDDSGFQGSGDVISLISGQARHQNGIVPVHRVGAVVSRADTDHVSSPWRTA